MQAGLLRHRLSIQTPSRTKSDKSGERLVTYAEAGNAWARVRPLTARERTYAKQQGTEVTHEITVRYTDLITPDCQIVWNARTFVIVGIRNVEERNRELLITAKEYTQP